MTNQSDKIKKMDNEGYPGFLTPGKEILDIKTKINELVDWINSHNHLSSNSLESDYLNKKKEEWQEAAKGDGV